MKNKWSGNYIATPDYLREQARATCGDHPLFALIELITNSNEAYNKLDYKGIKHRGEIIIEVYPRRQGLTKYSVKDFALGLDEQDFTKKVQEMGGDMSGLTKEIGGRSYWGRGLKEALINFGYGEIISIKNGKLYKATSKDVTLSFEGEKDVFKTDRDEYGVKSDENFTCINLIARNTHIQKTPQFESLKYLLSKYFELRDILVKDSRKIILRYIKDKDNVINEEVISYSPVESKKIREIEVKLRDFPEAIISLEIFEAEKDIPYTQEKYLSERGFLICSKNAIHAVDYFGFQNHSAAARIFGRVTSEYIDYLLRDKREPLFDPTRSGGTNQKNLFIKSLSAEVQKLLGPIFEEYGQAINKDSEIKDEETDSNMKKVLDYFNKIAKNLFDIDDNKINAGHKKPKKKKEDLPPPDGFNFMPPYLQIVKGKPSTVTLKLVSEYEKIKDKIEIISENKDVEILKEQKRIWEYNEKKDFYVYRISILGKNVGNSSTLVATLGKMETRAKIEVINEKKGAGLFNDWSIERGLPPEQRVQYIRGIGKIIVSADAPSVSPFIALNKIRSMETKILISELILYSCCNEIARQMILRGKEPLLRTDPDGIAEQIQDLLVRQVNQHARNVQMLVIKGKLEEHLKK